jgi:hypothetical protein
MFQVDIGYTLETTYMSEHQGHGPDETLISAAPERFDFSPLAHFDAASVPVISLQLSDLMCVGRGEAPFASALGESCGEPGCRYRAHALTLHASPHALLAGFADRAAASALPLELVIEELAVDIYCVRSRGAIPCIDLEHHPIRDQLALSPERLGARPAESPEWELVRSLRDLRRTRAIRLAGGDSEVQRLILHADLARELHVERLGALPDVLPIVPAGFGAGSLAASLARRLRCRTYRKLTPANQTKKGP